MTRKGIEMLDRKELDLAASGAGVGEALYLVEESSETRKVDFHSDCSRIRERGRDVERREPD